MEENRRLPENNLELVCPKCGNSYSIWCLRLYDGECQKRLAHNFCPSNEAFPGRIVDICMRCKMEEVESLWNKEKC